MIRSLLPCLVLAVGATSAIPKTMRAVLVSGSAKEGDFSNVKVVSDHPVPRPGHGQVLIKVAASSVNPVDWKLMSMPGVFTFAKVAGFDVAGTVVEMGSGCTRLKIGDAVWADLGKSKLLPPGPQLGAWAEYAVADESQVGLKPETLNMQMAASLPLVGLTDLQALRMTGAPWVQKNITVAITSGSGGTGTPAIQLARAYGATRVVTASSPSHFELLKSLGATDVIDYHKSTIWEALGKDSVDVVYDNFGAPGTADAAMNSIRKGGVFIYLPGKNGAVSKHPKEGVKQINYGLCDSSRHEDLDALAEVAGAGRLRGVVAEAFGLEDIKLALNASFQGHAVGKVGVRVAATAAEVQYV